MATYRIDLYLSPSTQEHNPCVLGDVEETHQNVIADYMEPYLKASGITYARNNRYTMTHYESMQDSNRRGARMHYALHTNANSKNPNSHGERCYRNPLKSASVKAANILVNWQKKIYREPAACTINTPIKKYTELYLVHAEIAIIDEIGYHTNRPDMLWVHGSAKAIAKNKVQAICEILGKKFVDIDAAGGGGSPKPEPTPIPTEYISYDKRSKGENVSIAQRRLIAHGAKLTVTGEFGLVTDKSVRAFQKSHGLDDDGVVGPKTWSELFK